jgi:hypothetical protein
MLTTDISVGGCRALNGSCSLLAVKYLKTLQKIEKTDCSAKENTCFFDAIARHYIRTENKAKLRKYARNNFIIDIKSPVRVSDIAKFERQNSGLPGMAINVLYAEEKLVYPIVVTKNFSVENAINLLLYKTRLGDKTVNHYAYIDDLETLLKREYFGKRRKYYRKSHYCLNCLQKFTSFKLKVEHATMCILNKPQKVILPEEGDVMSFQNHSRKFLTDLWGTFDYEALQQKPDHACSRCKDGPCAHKTTVESEQNAVSSKILILQTEGKKVIFQKTYSGLDCPQVMIEDLLDIEDELLGMLNNYPEHNLSNEEEEAFQMAECCHICDELLGLDRTRDHSHFSGKYMG